MNRPPTISEFFSMRNMKNLANKTVLLRADFNIPVENDKISKYSLNRINATLPTISYLLKSDARLIIASHHGDTSQSLKPMAEYLKNKIPIKFCPSLSFDKILSETKKLQPGEALLMENLRMFPGETSNDTAFSQQLASLADIYINDAFPVSHRKHASIVGIPEFLPSYFGEAFIEEVQNLSRLLNPQKPFTLIVGGGKFSTKIALIKKFINKADNIIIGGALANVFLKNTGKEIGLSKYEPVDTSDIQDSPKIILPATVVVEHRNGETSTVPTENVSPSDTIVDTSTGFTSDIEQIIDSSATIFMNGPFGWYEKGFLKGTEHIIKLLNKNDEKQFSCAGGGDIAYVVNKLNLRKNFDFISNGGGASLHFLSHETLPGIEAIVNNKNQTV